MTFPTAIAHQERATAAKVDSAWVFAINKVGWCSGALHLDAAAAQHGPESE
jgi:hypothetical protein